MTRSPCGLKTGDIVAHCPHIELDPSTWVEGDNHYFYSIKGSIIMTPDGQVEPVAFMACAFCGREYGKRGCEKIPIGGTGKWPEIPKKS